MSDSKSGSANDLNESTLPLIETEEKQGDTPEKEVQEMEMDEKKDDSEKDNEKDTKKDKKDKKEKEKKEKNHKKEKQTKQKKEKTPGPSCLDVLTADLNLSNRDHNNINQEINIDFSCVVGEPAAVHGLDPIWRLSSLLFSQTKLWVYRVLAALISLPLALLWGVVFSLISVVHIWAIRPVLRILDVVLDVLKKVLRGVVGATLSPVTESLGLIFSRSPQNTIETA